MRPLSIELEGFSAYRSPVAVDFNGIDFFSLAGPTGSGKSSLIDAMIFALFGRVPRLGGNTVAPAITAGADRARVRFDFEVGDRQYTAVRLAARTPTGGASVKEARLQEGEKVLASGADEVTAAVEELLKLSFDDFTRTVVLPQGDFAQFLKARKGERQDLLRNLLGMDVYTTVRDLAQVRAKVAGERAQDASRSLESLQPADEKEMKRAALRLERLGALSEALPEHEKELSELEVARSDAEKHKLRIDDAIERVTAIEAPARLADLDDLITKARSDLVDAEERRLEAISKTAEAQTALEALPTAEQIETWAQTYLRLTEVEGRLQESDPAHAQARVAKSNEQIQSGLADLANVRDRLEAARHDHSASLLTATLVVGEPCPVCDQHVDRVPKRQAPSRLDDLVKEEKRLTGVVDEARATAEQAREALTRLETGVAALVEQQSELNNQLAGAPAVDDLESLQTSLGIRVTELEAARHTQADREAEEKKVRTALEDLADDARRVAKQLREAERTVADLDPPLSEADDAIVQWKELISWRDERLDGLRAEATDAAAVMEAALERSALARKRLTDLLLEHDIEGADAPRVLVATALLHARALVEAQEKAAQDAANLKTQFEEASEQSSVASALANHLRANGFEQWLMAGALTELVAGANELLGQLSGDGYSLHSDESGSFSIVDHRNADEIRSVSTLSGGETFLVALALALSLAETLASKGGSGLDAIILDEGFGTLDDESLDTVASVLEELTGRGLMVGVITHVKELAARAPSRFEVTRGPGGASVKVVS